MWGERRMFRAPTIRMVATMMNVQPARIAAGGAFLDGLTGREFEVVAAALHPEVTMRALLPSGTREWQGRAEVAAAFRGWFGAADEFAVVDATVGDVAGRLHLAWRARLRPAPFDNGDGWHVIEQHAFVNAAELIDRIDLMCSGFRPDTVNTSNKGDQ